MSQPGPPPQIELRICQAMAEIPKASWDALHEGSGNPFMGWAFLNALEETGCVKPRRGWWPCHLTCWQGDDLLAAAPAYIKNDGMGDFSRDWAMGDLVQRYGVSFYPKLIVGVPFSPVTGRRILVQPGQDSKPLTQALMALAVELAKENELSSVHVLYHLEDEADALASAGLTTRGMIQYHWKNYSYAHPDDWLGRLKSKRRNQAKRERAAPEQQGIRIETQRREALHEDPERWANTAYNLYATTCQKYMWGGTYLNRDFYRFLFTEMSDSVELVTADLNGECIAGAINVATSTHLYGRYWGCHQEHPFLHFNVCLYHSIDQCIDRGIQVFEGGAGGEHKMKRGFEPSMVYSGHLFLDEELNQVLSQALAHDLQGREDHLAKWYREKGLNR